jgi:4-alpha-glucanotransferase
VVAVRLFRHDIIFMRESDHNAAGWAVEAGYHDVFGVWHPAPVHTVQAVTAALASGRTRPEEYPRGWPAMAHQAGRDGMWGLAAQLYSVRSASNWGHGDFGDLKRLIEIAGQAGASAVGLNPLHALFPDRPEHASPYAPNSRLYLNPLYIDLTAVPDFPGLRALGLEEEIAVLRATDMIAYDRVARAKVAALKAGYEAFRSGGDGERARDLACYQVEQGEALERFAAFEVLRERFGTGAWWNWPEPWRRPTAERLAELGNCEERALGFHRYVQWIADRQLRDCQHAANSLRMPIGLYLDIAVGVDPAGADAWSAQDDMLVGVSVGAPPDQFNPAGQDWGLTTFNPQALIARNFEPFRRMLRSAMRHAGAIRIDHVLGLMRLYLIPKGVSAAEGAYVSLPFEALLSVAAEESARQGCVVIGEDLGTVPAGLREALARRGLWSYSVMLFEREHDGSFRAPERFPANALATFATHDLPPFAGWMTGWDLSFKRSIGVDPGETDEERAHSRERLHEALARYSANDGFAAVARYLARTPARLVMVTLEDVMGVVEQVNIPGTVDQYPNWRRLLPAALDGFADDAGLQKIAAMFAETGRAFAGVSRESGGGRP